MVVGFCYLWTEPGWLFHFDSKLSRAVISLIVEYFPRIQIRIYPSETIS